MPRSLKRTTAHLLDEKDGWRRPPSAGFLLAI